MWVGSDCQIVCDQDNGRNSHRGRDGHPNTLEAIYSAQRPEASLALFKMLGPALISNTVKRRPSRRTRRHDALDPETSVLNKFSVSAAQSCIVAAQVTNEEEKIGNTTYLRLRRSNKPSKRDCRLA